MSQTHLTYEEVLDVFREAEDPVLTSSDIASALNISSTAANNRLDNLQDRGEIVRKEVGASAVVYWLPD